MTCPPDPWHKEAPGSVDGKRPPLCSCAIPRRCDHEWAEPPPAACPLTPPRTQDAPDLDRRAGFAELQIVTSPRGRLSYTKAVTRAERHEITCRHRGREARHGRFGASGPHAGHGVGGQPPGVSSGLLAESGVISRWRARLFEASAE
jgi:hypothetical protein